jgi:hypothetical protein
MMRHVEVIWPCPGVMLCTAVVFWLAGRRWVMAAPFDPEPGPGRPAGADVLVLRAERTGQRRPGTLGRDVLRFAFYGRISTEDWQDPVTSQARQLQQAVMLTAGHGKIVAEFFDAGESRALPWARRSPPRWRTRIVGGTRS